MRKWLLAILGVFGGLAIAGGAAFYFMVWRAGTEESDYLTLTNPGTSLGIVRQPAAADIRPAVWNRSRVPRYDPENDPPFQVDLRSRELAETDLSQRLPDLLHACFDSRTRWPARLPTGFDPERIMAEGLNPGLQIRALHHKSITGQGVGLAIIDQPLLVEHAEYRERLRLYEEIHVPSWEYPSAQMHGPAVAALAAGRRAGVAPDADLYFIACTPGRYLGFERLEWDLSWLGQAINRVLDVNEYLPADRKIRVISISLGWVGAEKIRGYAGAEEALQRARREKLLVVTTTLGKTYGCELFGLEREPGRDPDDWRSYTPGQWWRHEFGTKDPHVVPSRMLLVPMASRGTASPTGISDYVFYRDGGESWSVPYLAGLYALACQVRPDITPEAFLQLAEATGDTTSFDWKGRAFPVRTIVNPLRLIERLREKDACSLP